MTIGVVKNPLDSRVALIPKAFKDLIAMGASAILENGAGEKAGFLDAEYVENGKTLNRQDVLSTSDIVLSVLPLDLAEYDQVQKNAIVISMFAPYQDSQLADTLTNKGLKVLSMDMIPRSTIAQSMDILSSMASISGYKAVLEAANHLDKYIPMMMTAAGTVKPAKVVILGAGVAGLQAIATAKRLGAIVEVSDPRVAVKEEVKSLGGKFIEVEGAADSKDAGGYAVAQSEDYLKRQRDLVQKKAVEADIVICTAQVRGRKAPLLIPAETVEKMRPGSVIVDLATSTGGNCALSKDNETLIVKGVTIIGSSSLASKVARDASLMFSNNMMNFFKIFIKEGQPLWDMENEIIRNTLHHIKQPND